MVEAPVVYCVFNRPEPTRATFARIRSARPKRLLIVADGPRSHVPTDHSRCQLVRELVADIDWPCEVDRNYAESNLGLKQRISSGLDWAFEQVESAMILEDDCLASDEFFRFCDEMLVRYADDERVMTVTGDNFQENIWRGQASYYFSKYPHCWGWATWSRAWSQYDGSIGFWPEFRNTPAWKNLHPDAVERRYWERILESVSNDKINSWAYPWTASVWRKGGLTATPNSNLVDNIGFGDDATHTKGFVERSATSLQALPQPLCHPTNIAADADADAYAFDNHFDGARLRRRRTVLGYSTWLMRGVGRRSRRAYQNATTWVESKTVRAR